MHPLRVAALQHLEEDSDEALVAAHPAPPHRLPLDLLLLHRVYFHRAVLFDFRQDHRYQVAVDPALVLCEHALQGEDGDTGG